MTAKLAYRTIMARVHQIQRMEKGGEYRVAAGLDQRWGADFAVLHEGSALYHRGYRNFSSGTADKNRGNMDCHGAFVQTHGKKSAL